MPPLASLVIPTRNRATFLARTLTSFVQQDTKDFEVIIVDDGGTDTTRDVARSFESEIDIRYVRRAHSGRSMSRNAAIRASTGKLLILCDDDRVAHPSYVSDHLAAHAGSTPRVVGGRQRALFAEWGPQIAYTAGDVARFVAKHPDLVGKLAEPCEIVSCQMLRDDLAGTLDRFGIDELWWETFAHPVIEAYGTDLAEFRFPWTMGVGGNTSVPRDLADAVGLHDEKFTGWGLEDTEFHYRLHVAGAITIMADRALNYHQVHDRGPERSQEWAINAVRFLAKHDSLDAYLYIATCRRSLTLGHANQILIERDAIGDAAPGLIAELVRMHKEQFRLVIGAV